MTAFLRMFMHVRCSYLNQLLYLMADL